MTKIKPCGNCPFRTDNNFPLTRARRKEISTSLDNDGYFPCHKTTEFDEDNNVINLENSRICIGAAIFLENAVKGGMMSNLFFRLVLANDRENIDFDFPIFKTITDFVCANGKN